MSATPQDSYMFLNSDVAKNDISGVWGTSAFTSTDFRVCDFGGWNLSGGTYVAYLFAHNAGGFGLTGTDNVISCGSFTTDGSGNATVNLGYEPQWVLVKSSVNATGWIILDTMRGWNESSNDRGLAPNSSGAESTFSGQYGTPTATGFTVASNFGTSDTNIYIAIRRGPMKVPTDATKVFTPGRGTDAASTFITTGFPSDFSIQRWMGGADNNLFSDRLRGFSPADATASPYLVSNTTGAEVSATATNFGYTNTGFQIGSNSGGNWWALNFRRAPSFFDEVCYTGDDVFNRAIPHNLAAVPELVIAKNRSYSPSNWAVYSSATSLGNSMALNTTASASANPYIWGSSSPTSTNFYVGDDTRTNGGTFGIVLYLFASCPGVSKVGSYTGTGATQTINCGFTAGARFVLIKRTDSTGSWYVWDVARGISSGNDPYLLLNSTAAEVTNTDYIDAYSAGFEISSTAPAEINASGGTFIYLSIA